MALTIFCEVFPSPNGFGSLFNFLVICSWFFMIFLAVLVIFCGFVPVRWLAPSWTVSVHSVFLRRVMHGVFSQKASFCIPPESVRMSFAFFTSFSVS